MPVTGRFWRFTAFLTGLAPIILVLFPLQLFLGTDSRLLIPGLAAGYGLAGGLLGFCLPDKGWRLWLWLIAFSFLKFVGNALFVGSAPVDPSKEIRGPIEYLFVIAVAFVGVAVGSILGRRTELRMRRQQPE